MPGSTVFARYRTRNGRRAGRAPGPRSASFAPSVARCRAAHTSPARLETFGEVPEPGHARIAASCVWVGHLLDERFESGGAGREGRLLLRIDPRDAQPALDTAETDLSEAKADLAEGRERRRTSARDELCRAEDQAAPARTRTSAPARPHGPGVGTELRWKTAELAGSAPDRKMLARRQA